MREFCEKIYVLSWWNFSSASRVYKAFIDRVEAERELENVKPVAQDGEWTVSEVPIYPTFGRWQKDE